MPTGDSQYCIAEQYRYVLHSTAQCHGNVCGVCGSEHAYIATKWRSVMNLAMKYAENDSEKQ